MSITVTNPAVALVAELLNNNAGSYATSANESWTPVVQTTAGSNCGNSVVLRFKDTDQILDARNIGRAVFGSGRRCLTMSRRWDILVAHYHLPEEFTWETAIVVAAARYHGGLFPTDHELLAAWAHIFVDPCEALGL